MAFANIRNNKIIDFNSNYLDNDIVRVETSEDIYNAYLEDKLKVVYSENENAVVLNPDYEADKYLQQREEMDKLSLTPSDVERALYKAKGMDFDDLKTLIAQQAPTLDIKALSIEFRAKDFYRGATLSNGIRLIDTVGAILGYTSEDMDYLFLNKELPLKVNQ